jgi:hypothetical protein
MPREPLIPAGAAERAALRGWLAEDAEHATLAVLHGRYAVKDGLHFLITFALHHARLAKIPDGLARSVAVAMFWEVLADHHAKLERLHWDMVDAARLSLRQHRDFVAASRTVADLARAGRATPGMVTAALRIAARTA